MAGRGGCIKKQERAAWKLRSLAMAGMATACALRELAEARASQSERGSWDSMRQGNRARAWLHQVTRDGEVVNGHSTEEPRGVSSL